MKITVETTTTQSKEIELPEFPFYLKGKDCAYKIIDAKRCISITDYFLITIEGNYYSQIVFEKFEKLEIIEKDEFLIFYNMIINKITADF